MVFMIRINLLPPEDRVQESSMLGALLAGLAGLGAILVLFLGLNYTSQQLFRLEQAKKARLSELNERKKKLQELQNKKQLVKKALERQNLIISISMGKINWSEKLYELSKIIERHPVWVTSIEMDEKARRFRMKCYCKGWDERKIVEFRKSILNSRNFFSIFESVKLYSDITPIMLDKPTRTEEDKKVLRFTLEFKLKPQLALQNLIRQ